MQLTPTTELEAVNEMLGTIGESPVSDLVSASSVDVAVARDILRAASRETQSKGWWFNHDEGYTFVLNAQKQVVPANDILSLRPSLGGAQLILRNGKVYDRRRKADTFTSAPTCDVVWFFNYESLPESARRYIAIRAARIFQKRVLGSEALDVFTEDDERAAYTVFASEHDDFVFADGHNFLASQDATDIWDK